MYYKTYAAVDYRGFNPLDRGNLYQITEKYELVKADDTKQFQSPRSGKFVSDSQTRMTIMIEEPRFNPLDRGNLYQILQKIVETQPVPKMFQSPRSGKFVSDKFLRLTLTKICKFQSPRSGKFVSDSPKNACKLTMSFKRTTLCRHYITNGKMFENVAKRIFQIRTLLLMDSLR